MWNISNDHVMMVLAMTMNDFPMAVNMSFRREYAEPYEWMQQQFKDIAFAYLTSMLYYEDYGRMTPESRLPMRQGMAAFGGIAPTYKIALLDKPTIVWDSHSLMPCAQMMFSLMVTDQDKPIRM